MFSLLYVPVWCSNLKILTTASPLQQGVSYAYIIIVFIPRLGNNLVLEFQNFNHSHHTIFSSSHNHAFVKIYVYSKALHWFHSQVFIVQITIKIGLVLTLISYTWVFYLKTFWDETSEAFPIFFLRKLKITNNHNAYQHFYGPNLIFQKDLNNIIFIFATNLYFYWTDSRFNLASLRHGLVVFFYSDFILTQFSSKRWSNGAGFW